jgi:hypothetical protein
MYNKNSPKKIFFLGLDKHFFQFFLNLGRIFYNKMTFSTLDKPSKGEKWGFMDQNLSNIALQIIEVPPELRGLTDEEIIQKSEKIKKDFSGKRKNGAARPSKKDRLALKQQKEFQEAQSIANEIFGSIPKQSDLYFKPKTQIPGIPPMSELPLEKQMMLKAAFTEESKGYSAYDLKSSSEFVKPKAMISETPKPASGRVLKASFGAKTGDKPKAVIVSAADHAKQKAEERAKKIQDFFKAKHPEATVMPDGTPVKRGRGRPRKNPVV